MKVILLQNVPKIGQKGDVKDLKDGYVHNMLLPRGLAKIATNSELKSLEIQSKKHQEYQNAEVSRVANIFKRMEKLVVVLSEKKNEKGHLFAKVGIDEIVKAVRKQAGIELDANWMSIDPIKEVGDYSVNLSSDKLKSNFILRVN